MGGFWKKLLGTDNDISPTFGITKEQFQECLNSVSQYKPSMDEFRSDRDLARWIENALSYECVKRRYGRIPLGGIEITITPGDKPKSVNFWAKLTRPLTPIPADELRKSWEIAGNEQ